MQQLSLVETTKTWRLDDETREIGRAGVANARTVLADARRRRHDGGVDRPEAA